MFNISRNICRILFKRKGFIFVTFILPAILVFFFSASMGAMGKINVGVYNKDNGELSKAIEKKLANMNGANIVKVNSEEEYISNLIFEECTLVVVIDENFTEDIIKGKENTIKVKSLNAGDVAPIVKNYLESEVSSLATLCNNIEVEKSGINKIIETFNGSKANYNILNVTTKSNNPINSLGIVLYITFITAAMSCVFALEDERQGTKERILLSNVSEKQYYGAQLLVYFLLSSVPAIEYYIIAKIFKYDFGFKYDFIILILLLMVVLLAVTFGLFLSTIVKNKMVFSVMMTTFTIPVFMLSGAYWPFEMMGKGIQKVGNALPIRWIYIIIEKLQKGEGIMKISPYVVCLMLFILVLFLLSVFCTKNKIVLLKESK